LPFESRDQAEIVEHGRAEEKSDVADGFDGGFGDGFYAVDLGMRDAVLGRDEFCELADFDEKGAERLADFIVQFPGDGAALFLLSLHEAGGEAFEFEAAAGERVISQTSLALEAEDIPAADKRHQDAGDQGERHEPDEAGFERLKAGGDGEVFESEFALVRRGDLRGEFKDAGAPGNELLADELIGALPAKIGAPSQYDGAGGFSFLKLLFDGREEKLFVGITVGGETEQSSAGRSDLFGYVGGVGCGLFKLVPEQEALDLVVIDADGNYDGGEGAIAGGEAATHFLGGAFETANGEESVHAGAD
jgi:hypothetical protein